MAVMTVAADLVVKKWSKKLFREYHRMERFNSHTGTGGNNVFRVFTDLESGAGDKVVCSFTPRLTGDGIEGDDTLWGNEEEGHDYADTVEVDQLRNAVKMGNHERRKSEIDFLEAHKESLRDWAADAMRNLKIARLLAPTSDGVTAYASASEADKDTFLGNNTDRYLFGQLLSNRSTTDHSASLLNVDTTDDTLDTGIVSLLKRVAKAADPRIMPIRADGGREHYIAYCSTNPMRDLRASLSTVHQNAAPRSLKENPLFRDDDLLWEDVIIREIPEMASIGNVGATSAPVYQVAFCGAQAVLVAYAETIKAISDVDDYGNLQGRGVAETRGAKKTIFNSKMHGMVTGYVAAAADA